MKLLGVASLPWGKPGFPHVPPSSKARLARCAAQIGASAEDGGVT